MRFWIYPVVVAILSFATPAAAQEAPVRAAFEPQANGDSSASRLPIQDNWLSSDKAFHLASSAFLTAGGFYFLHQEQEVERAKSLLISASVSLVIGIGKEIYDRRKPKHVASWKDLAIDVAGIGIAIFILKQ
jgi:uncharacterized protein YfiM (DUF2279 family)